MTTNKGLLILVLTFQTLTLFGQDYKDYTSLKKALKKKDKVYFLHLDSQGIDSIPSTIGELKNVGYFYLSFNKLKALPTEIGELRKLIRFTVHYNQLSSLPVYILTMLTPCSHDTDPSEEVMWKNSISKNDFGLQSYDFFLNDSPFSSRR